MGWISSSKVGDFSVGRAYEKLLNIKANSSKKADFKDFIEIKSYRKNTHSRITLFTCTPHSGRVFLDNFRKTYGRKRSGSTQLYSTIRCNKDTNSSRFSFRAYVNHIDRRVDICVFSKKGREKIDHFKLISFDDLEIKIKDKFSALALVSAEVKKKGGKENFMYDDLNLYSGASLNNFLALLESGDIVCEFRLGFSKSKSSYGKLRDHGTAFRISRRRINLMFNKEHPFTY